MNVVRAATEGDVETVKQWLSASRQRHPVHAWQVLNQAATHGHENICQLVLNSVEISDDCIAIALLKACGFNQLSTAQLLVRHGHISTQHLTEALSHACLNCHARIVTWLISDIMTLSHTDRIEWLLIAACARGDMSDITRLATQVDSDVKRVMSQALRVACYNRRDNVVKWLTSHTTANVSSLGMINKETDGEMTSLMVACSEGNCDTVSQLMQCVTPHTVNMMSGNMRNTAMYFIILSEVKANLQYVEACINGNIDTAADKLHVSNLNLQVAGGTTALHCACMHGYVEIVRMLLSGFASTDVTDDDRRTPAMVAELLGHTEVLPYLQCTLSDPPDIRVQVSDNNNTVSISVLSVEDATKPKNNLKKYGSKLSRTRLV